MPVYAAVVNTVQFTTADAIMTSIDATLSGNARLDKTATGSLPISPIAGRRPSKQSSLESVFATISSPHTGELFILVLCHLVSFVDSSFAPYTTNSLSHLE